MNTIVTHSWVSWIDLMPGAKHKLYVVGEVEANTVNLIPTLIEAISQGSNTSILILDLTVTREGGVGAGDVALRPVRFEKPAKKGQYSQVEVRFEGESTRLIPVREVQ